MQSTIIIASCAYDPTSAKLIAHVALRTACSCPCSEPHPSVLSLTSVSASGLYLLSGCKNQCTLKARGVYEDVLKGWSYGS